MKVFRGDRGLLSRPRKLRNGFLQTDAFLTRVGVFPYRNRDGTVRRELRLPSEVFNPDSMATFAMMPLTMGHPNVPVTARNARQHSIGHTGQDVRRDGEKMRATIMVTDDQAISEMRRGRREISNGYFCDLEMTSGITKDIDGIPDGLEYDCIQRNIEGNHVAVVDRGRAGPDVHARVDEMRCDGLEDIAWSELRFDDDDQLRLDNPYEIKKSGDTFQVVKSADGKVMGTHPSREAATKQLAALEAAESERGDNAQAFLNMFQRMGKLVATKDGSYLHNIGMVAFPLIMERGLTMTELAQALGVQENGVEPLLAGEVMPTGKQLEGLAELLDVPADELKDLLPEKQRAQTDREDSTMEDFEITLNGVTFKLKGDTAARQAVTKALGDGEQKIDELQAEMAKKDSEHAEALTKETARADAAEEAKTKAEAERDAATDPSSIRKRIDARVALERTAAEVLGEKFDEAAEKLDDEELRKKVILAVQPTATLDGKDEVYIRARYDSAVELHKENNPGEPTGIHRVRAAANNSTGGRADGDVGSSHGGTVNKARADMIKRNREAWRTPMTHSKDARPN